MSLIRKLFAIWVGKLLLVLCRLFGNKGTVLPGYGARAIYPGVLEDLSRHITKGIIVITGTNGKTTTADLLTHIIRHTSHSVVHNLGGANMLTGITTACIRSTNIWGNRALDYAVFETDEANIPLLLKEIKANMLLITNFFNDQLDRYGELDYTLNIVKNALINSGIKLFLNADDPLVCNFEQVTKCNTFYFGGDFSDFISDGVNNHEGKYCAFCGEQIIYSKIYYSQIGKFKCNNCGNHNHRIDTLASNCRQSPNIEVDIEGIHLSTNLTGFYNVYNVLAATALALHIGIDENTIIKAVESFSASSGRMESFYLKNGSQAVLTLVKNPAGFNQILQAITADKEEKVLVFVINANAADGRDISWLWDVEIEKHIIKENNISRVYCAGQRSGDIALRIKYSLWPQDQLIILDDYNSQLREMIREVKVKKYIICTYTALFQVRQVLQANKTASEHPNDSRLKQNIT